jgi:hypothetical protein
MSSPAIGFRTRTRLGLPNPLNHDRLVLFLFFGYDPGMKEATQDEIARSLSFALLFNDRKRTHDSDELIARIVAQHLAKHLLGSGFVVMKKPPRMGHSTSSFVPDGQD